MIDFSLLSSMFACHEHLLVRFDYYDVKIVLLREVRYERCIKIS